MISSSDESVSDFESNALLMKWYNSSKRKKKERVSLSLKKVKVDNERLDIVDPDPEPELEPEPEPEPEPEENQSIEIEEKGITINHLNLPSGSSSHEFNEDHANNIGDYLFYDTSFELNNAIRSLEIDTTTKYNLKNKHKGFDDDTTLSDYLTTISSEKDIKISWENNYSGDYTPIEFNGTPFVFLNKRRYVCHQGKDKDEITKKKRQEKADSANSEHYSRKKRQRSMESKKLNCPAQFTVKKILYFPEFSISSDTKRKRLHAAKLLREGLMKAKNSHTSNGNFDDDVDFVVGKMKPKKKEIVVSLQFITKFPSMSDHQFHHQGQAAGLIEPLDEEVRDFVKKIVRGGVRRKAEILSRIADFVNNDLFAGEPNPDRLRRRFKPDAQTIRNLISSVKSETRFSKFDQENVAELKKSGSRMAM